MDIKTQSSSIDSSEVDARCETHTDMFINTVDEQLFRELSSLSCALDRNIFNDDESHEMLATAVDEVQTVSNAFNNSNSHNLHSVSDLNGHSFEGLPTVNPSKLEQDGKRFGKTELDDDEPSELFLREFEDVENDIFESNEAVNEQALLWTRRLDKLILDISDDSTNNTDTESPVRLVANPACGEFNADFDENCSNRLKEEPAELLTIPDSYDVIDTSPVVNNSLSECIKLPSVEFQTGIICLDVSDAQDILTTRYKLHDILIKKSVITWSRWNLSDLINTPLDHSSVWKKPSHNNRAVQSARRREINKDIDRRNDAIEWMLRQKDIQFQSEAALFSTSKRNGTLPSSSATKKSDAGSSSWPRTKSDKTAPPCLPAGLNSSSANRKGSVIALSSIMEYNEPGSQDDKYLTEHHQSMAATNGDMTDIQCAGNDTPLTPNEGFIHRWVRTLSKTLHRQRE